MRLVLALIYMSFGMWAYFFLGGSNLHLYLGIGFAFILMFSSVIVCNEGFIQRVRGQSDEDRVSQLVKENKASIESYKVQEAFTFEDKNTGCLGHILQISKDRAICLYGQYLYEYSEITDDEEINQERQFPTSEFKVTRLLKGKDIIRMEIGDSVFPEHKIDDKSIQYLREFGFTLTDGEIVEGLNFLEFRSRIGGTG